MGMIMPKDTLIGQWPIGGAAGNPITAVVTAVIIIPIIDTIMPAVQAQPFPFKKPYVSIKYNMPMIRKTDPNMMKNHAGTSAGNIAVKTRNPALPTNPITPPIIAKTANTVTPVGLFFASSGIFLTLQ